MRAISPGGEKGHKFFTARVTLAMARPNANGSLNFMVSTFTDAQPLRKNCPHGVAFMILESWPPRTCRGLDFSRNRSLRSFGKSPVDWVRWR